MADGRPTTRTTLRTGYVRELVFCNACQHQADADLQTIVDAGRGDLPLTELRLSCSQCGTDGPTRRHPDDFGSERGRQLATLLEDGAHRSNFCLGDDEH